MPVSRLGTSRSDNDLPHNGVGGDSELSLTPAAAAPGQGFADLLVLGALSCQTPVSLLSVPQPGGGWSTLSHGFDHRHGLNDGQLFEAFAGSARPLEFTDLMTTMPRSPLVQAPHAMRWAYGVALRDANGALLGVVAVMDRWLRQLTKREQRAMAALGRLLLVELSNLRRPIDAGDFAGGDGRPVYRRVPRSAPNTAGHPSRMGAVGVDAPQLLRSHEVATIFDVTERTVINWAAAGKLPSLRTIGGHLRFRRDDVMRLLAGAEELSSH
jgi:excisionase family DNA binding protein